MNVLLLMDSVIKYVTIPLDPLAVPVTKDTHYYQMVSLVKVYTSQQDTWLQQWFMNLFITDNNECTDGTVTIGGMVDINDTMSYGWCQQQCINVPGGYECGCIDGYSLQDNTITCAGNVLSLQL